MYIILDHIQIVSERSFSYLQVLKQSASDYMKSFDPSQYVSIDIAQIFACALQKFLIPVVLIISKIISLDCISALCPFTSLSTITHLI